jgi:hypothetical protein
MLRIAFLIDSGSSGHFSTTSLKSGAFSRVENKPETRFWFSDLLSGLSVVVTGLFSKVC